MIKERLTEPAAGSGDNDGTTSSSFTLINALSTSFPFPLSFRVPFVFPFEIPDMLSSKLIPELDRDKDGAWVSGSTSIARASESGIDGIDDAVVIPLGPRESDVGSTAFILRAEARWARPAELLTKHTEKKGRDVDRCRVDHQGLLCKNSMGSNARTGRIHQRLAFI